MKKTPWRIGRKRPRIPKPINTQPMIQNPISLNVFIIGDV
jgi:hypothetical protein